MRPIDAYFLEKEGPIRECLLYLRSYISDFDEGITETMKYGMPFYTFNGKMMCYLWTDKKSGWPYLGVVDGNRIDHPELIAEKRSRMKILLIDPLQEIPFELIETILQETIALKMSR